MSQAPGPAAPPPPPMGSPPRAQRPGRQAPRAQSWRASSTSEAAAPALWLRSATQANQPDNPASEVASAV